jgi:hypothetical protein
MDKKILNRVGLAAAILLVPGGLVLGAAYAAHRYRKRLDEAVDTEDASTDAVKAGPE